MKKRGKYLSIGIVIILFIFFFIFPVLGQEDLRNKVMDWNIKLAEYSEIQDERTLTEDELRNAITIAKDRKQEMIKIMKENQTLFSELILDNVLVDKLPGEVREYIESYETKIGEIRVLVSVVPKEIGHEMIEYTLSSEGLTFALFLDSDIIVDVKSRDEIKLSGYKLDNFIFVKDIRVIPQPGGGEESAAKGSQRIAVILVGFKDEPLNFPYQDYRGDEITFDYIRESLESDTEFYKEASYGKAEVEFDIFGPYNLESNLREFCTGFEGEAKAAARADGHSLQNYKKIVYVFTTKGEGYDSLCGHSWAGLSELTLWDRSSESWVLLKWITHRMGVTSHELGHAFGVWHANYLNCQGVSIRENIEDCDSIEYGDSFDVMGNDQKMHFNAIHKEKFGWIDNTEVVSGTGIYEIAPLENLGNNLLLIPRKNGGYYYLEYRAPIGFDANNRYREYNQGPILHVPHRAGSGDTVIIDTTPSQDGLIETGQVAISSWAAYNDPVEGFSIYNLYNDDNGVKIGVDFHDQQPQPIETKCVDLKNNNNPEKSLDITFIGDSISNSAVKSAAETFMNSIETDQSSEINNPFYIYRDKINIRYIEGKGGFANLGLIDLQCGKFGYQVCNSGMVFDITSKCPTDEIIVVSPNSNLNLKVTNILEPYGQYAFVNVPFNDRNFISSVIKELGKSMAFLADENNYGWNYFKTYFDDNKETVEFLRKRMQLYNFPNCEPRPICERNEKGELINCKCEKWKALTSECSRICGFEDWYSDSHFDIMGQGSRYLGKVDERQFNYAINRHIDYVKEPVSFEINKAGEDFVVREFLNKNKEPLVSEVPNIEYNKPLGVDVGELKFEWHESLLNMLCLGFTFESSYDCKNERLEDKVPPEVAIIFTDMKIEHESNDPKIPTEPNSIYITLTYKADIKGVAQITGDGEYGCIIKKKCSRGIVDIPWSATVDPIIIYVKLTYKEGGLGELEIEPTVLKVIRPKDIDIAPKGRIDVFYPGEMPNDFQARVLDLLFEGEGNPSLQFATENCGNGKECISKYINLALDNFGSLLRFSLDMTGTGIYPNTGKPSGLIYDLYLNNEAPLGGAEVLFDRLRFSGLASMGKPTPSYTANCVKEYRDGIEFPLTGSEGFNRDIGGEGFASAKISNSFANWHIWNLWNEGYFCKEKSISFDEVLKIFPYEEGSEDKIFKIVYSITFTKPPFIDYEISIKDYNLDGFIDFKDGIVSRGIVETKLDFYFMNDRGSYRIPLKIKQELKMPLVLEEPDVPLSREKGFSFAQSYLRTYASDVVLGEPEINCVVSSEDCESFLEKLFKDEQKQYFQNVIKEEVVGTLGRGIAESPVNPLRNIGIFGGVVGVNYFNPGVNLDLGEYIAEISNRKLDGKYMVYEMNLKKRCNEGECYPAGKAFVDKIEEIYYLEGNEPCIITDFSSRECADSIKAKAAEGNGKLYHYYKIYYSPENAVHNPYITYSYNLKSWNAYKNAFENGNYVQNIVYLSDDNPTYEKLLENREHGGNSEIENVPKSSGIHLFGWLNGETNIIVFRVKTPDGVEEELEKNCLAAVIFDKNCGKLECNPEAIYVKVRPDFRDKPNDNYIVCSGMEVPEIPL